VTDFAALKDLIVPLRRAWDEGDAASVLSDLLAPDAKIHLPYPFETANGPAAFTDAVLKPLTHAFPDLERRDTIVMAGTCGQGQDWVGCCGYYTGTFAKPFLDIPPTRRMASMRFHEFYRIEGGKVVEMQALWDIPELMMQSGVWPLVPTLGREWHVPGPATQDGLVVSGDGARALQVVTDMLSNLDHNRISVEAMRLPDFWHSKCSWYGPSGIGTARGIEGFRNHHQIPFLNGMPDREGGVDGGHLFAEGNYVGYTSFAGMSMTLSGPGWLGLPPTGQKITMRSLDFWRVEGDMIRENWVLVDLLHVYAQLGVDVFARMKELPQWTNASA
jgi:predicted ester cyclase